MHILKIHFVVECNFRKYLCFCVRIGISGFWYETEYFCWLSRSVEEVVDVEVVVAGAAVIVEAEVVEEDLGADSPEVSRSTSLWTSDNDAFLTNLIDLYDFKWKWNHLKVEIQSDPSSTVPRWWRWFCMICLDLPEPFSGGGPVRFVVLLSNLEIFPQY